MTYNVKYNQLFLLFSTLLIVICLFLYYSLKDLSKIKEDIRIISKKISEKSDSSVCAYDPKITKVNDTIDSMIKKEKIIDDSKVIKEILNEMSDDEEDDKDEEGIIEEIEG